MKRISNVIKCKHEVLTSNSIVKGLLGKMTSLVG